MSHQGAWESHVQGEAVQVDCLSEGSARDVRLLNWRDAATGEPCDTETVTHGSERDGGKRASNDTSPAVYSTSGRRSPHSTQPLGGTSETGGRGTGRGTREHGCTGGCIRPHSTEVSAWKAVCIERCMHGLGRGRRMWTAFLILPARRILHRQVGIPSGTSLAAYFTILRKGRFNYRSTVVLACSPTRRSEPTIWRTIAPFFYSIKQ
jgi:hypothetical protein